MQHLRLRILLCLLLLAAPASGAKKKDPEHDPNQIGQRAVGKGVNFYSIDREIALGREMAQETEREAKILDDPKAGEYVNRLVQNVVRNSDATVPFTVKIIDSDEINAFALPGGFMFVNTGLLVRAQSEAELAGVLAHEIAHVAARHGTRQATRGQLINIASIPLLFMGGWAGYAIREAVSVAVPLAFLKFSRDMEKEADLLGLEYMYKAGYDPAEFINFFERVQTLQKQKTGAVSKLFSTHPMTRDRIRAAQKEIQQDLRPMPQYLVDTSEFHDIRARLLMLDNRFSLREAPDRPVLRTRPRTPLPRAP